MLESLKPLLNNTLKPIAIVLARLRIHPNALTVTGVLLFGCGAWYIIQGKWIVALILIILGSFTDGLDGLVARQFDKKSTFGAILDSTCDRLTEILWFGGVVAYFMIHTDEMYSRWNVYLAFIALTGSLMISYIKARCEGAGVECKVGIMQRPERLILYCLLLLLGPRSMIWGLVFLAVSAYFTCVQRIIQAFKAAKKRDLESM